MASIILDDTTSLLSLTGDKNFTWSRIPVQRYFNQSAIYPPFSCSDDGDTGVFGSLSITFRGTSISFIGNTPPPFCSQSIRVYVDGGIPYDANYSDASPPSALQWYRSPTLPDALHSIAITRIAGVSIDYMVVTAGPKTPLSGQRLIVDDDDPAIVYSPNWIRKTGLYKSADDPSTGLPYGNATHQSSTPGSSATFQFAGTSVAVYSLFDYSHLGDLSVLYTLDSALFFKSHSVTKNTPEFRSGVLQRENVLLYSSDGLSPGAHTLRIEVKSSTNQSALSIDYIIYTPSFDTLSAKPNLSPISTTSVFSPLSTYGVGPTSPTGITPGSGTNKPTRVGAIVGGVVGGMALFVLLLVFFFYRKRLAKRTQYSDSSPPALDSVSIVPFTGMATDPGSPKMNSAKPYSPDALQANDDGSGSGDASDAPNFLQLSQEKPQFSQTQPGPTSPQDSPDPPGTVSLPNVGGVGGMTLRSRMQRLQDLVLELNREMAQNGENSIQGAVLRGRIAELTREDVDIGAGGDWAGQFARESTGTAVPPPYEQGQG